MKLDDFIAKSGDSMLVNVAYDGSSIDLLIPVGDTDEEIVVSALCRRVQLPCHVELNAGLAALRCDLMRSVKTEDVTAVATRNTFYKSALVISASL